MTAQRWIGAAMFVAILVGPGTARAVDFGFYGWDVRAGVALPSDWDTGFSLGVSADICELVDGLYLFPALRYFHAEDSMTFLGVDLSLEATDIAAGAEVRYFLSGKQEGWYFGGGGYAHLVDYEHHVGPAVASSSATRVGPGGVAGFRWKRETTSLLVEARYDVVSDFNRGEVLVGVSFGGAD